MFAFPDVFHFFAHKLARLSGRRLAFALIFTRAFDYFFFWHNKMITPLATPLDVNNKAARVTFRRFVVSKEPVLSSAWLTAALAATLLTATLFFALAPLTFALLSLAILLSPLLSWTGRFARLIWILFCVHSAFLIIELVVWVVRTQRLNRFQSNRREKRIGLETHNRVRGWLPYQAKSYRTLDHVI